MPEFSKHLKRERQRRGWSQMDIARELNIDQRTVSRWERGLQLPHPHYRQQLCTLFGKSAVELGLVEEEEGTAPAEPKPGERNNHGQNGERASPHQLHDTEALPIPSHVPVQDEEPSERGSPALGGGEDWDEAPRLRHFYGRQEELERLTSWILEDQCHLIAVLGMGGVGKTALVSQLVEQVRGEFEYIFWRSLQHTPPLSQILQELLQDIAPEASQSYKLSLDQQMALVIQALRHHRCLLVLDNAESLLQAGQQAGHYLDEYENYGLLFQRVGAANHESCLLLTSREKPLEVTKLEGKRESVRSLPLEGMRQDAAFALLSDKEFSGTPQEWQRLISLYAGNPLALKLVSESIADLFAGDLARFLQEQEHEIAFGDIHTLVDKQFQRLSHSEQGTLYWLALERDPVALETLFANFVPPVSRGTLLETLISLRHRSLIESRGSALFTLQPVIMEYVTAHFLELAFQQYQEVSGMLQKSRRKTGMTEDDPQEPRHDEIWTHYTFLKAQAKEYIQDIQRRLIVHPLSTQLQSITGKEQIISRLMRMLTRQREQQPHQQNYLAGNILNLLAALGADVRGTDFSQLAIRQAALKNVELPEVDFSSAHFEASSLSDTFGNILSLCFSPDGETIAAGTSSGAIHLYRISDGTLLHTYLGHSDDVWSLIFSLDGTQLISSSDDGSIRLWDIEHEESLMILQEHNGKVRALALSPDGRQLVSGGDDQSVRVWDLSCGECLEVKRAHEGRVWALAFSPDGTQLASGGTDKTVRLWETQHWTCLHGLPGHTGGIRSLAFSPDGTLLASGSDDSSIRLWQLSADEGGTCLQILKEHTNRVWSLAFSLDGKLLASGSEDQTVRLWDLREGHPFKVMHRHTQGVRSVAFHPQQFLLASGGDDQTLQLWESDTGYPVKTLQGYANRIWSLASSPDGKRLISGGDDQGLRLWNVESHSVHPSMQRHGHAHGVRAVAWEGSGNIFASGGDDRMVRLWNGTTGHHIVALKGHSNWIWAVAMSQDGRLVASGSEDQTVRIWQVSSRKSLYELSGHRGWVRALSFSPDGNLLASGSDDLTLRLWNTVTGQHVRTLTGHSGPIRAVAFSPDGQWLASSGEDHDLRLWNTTTCVCEQVLQGHRSAIRSLAFSPDSRLLASASDDESVCLWSIEQRQELAIVQQGEGRVRAVTFLPQQHPPFSHHHNASARPFLLASAGDDGIIRLWDATSQQLTGILRAARPYEGMKITGATGLTDAQRAMLKMLGAVDDEAIG